MFPLNKSNKMAAVQNISFNNNNNNNNNNNHNCHQQNIIPQDLIIQTHASVEPNTILASNNMGEGCPSRKLLVPSDNENDDDKKKMMHREIEKKRRREMAALHAVLRSLIPLEYIKGKRSMSDHMNGAVNYIEQLQMRLKELGARRDDLKNSDLRSAGSASGTSSDRATTSSCVEVHACQAGVEIVLSCDSSNTEPLSRVLQLLLGQGLSLLSCVTTKVSDVRLLHTIQAEVTDPECINLPELQKNLDEKISSWNKSP